MRGKNTPENRAIASVVVTMAIENMPLGHGFVNELQQVADGKKTLEQLRQEAIEQYKQE